MAKTGPKSKYDEWITEDGLTVLRGKARDGLTNEEICRTVIGISPGTLCEWMRRFPQIREALKKGREPVAIQIEESFYSRCHWTQKEEIREEIYQTSDGASSKRIVKTKKWFPPDTTAQIFALKNLKPERFRDKPIKADTLKNEIDPLSIAFEKYGAKLKNESE